MAIIHDVALTGDSSLEKILAAIEKDDPVGKKLANAQTHLSRAQEELGLATRRDDDGRRSNDER